MCSRWMLLPVCACLIASLTLTSCGDGGGGGGGGAATGFSFVAASNFSASQDVDAALWGVTDFASGLERVSDFGVRGFDKIRCVEFVGDVLYGVDTRSGYLCTIDMTTGVATPVGPTGFARIESLAYDSDTGKLYGFDVDTTQFIRIDTATGRATVALASTGAIQDIRALAFDRTTHRLFAYDNYNNFLFNFDPSTGAYTILGSHVLLAQGVESLSFDAAGVLYASARDGSDATILAVVDTVTAAAQLRGEFGMGKDPFQIVGMDFHPISGVLFGMDDDFDFELVYPSGPEDNSLVTINPANAAVTMVGASGCTRPEGLAYDTNAEVLYVTDSYSDMLSRVDVATGVATSIGRIGFDRVDGLAFDPTTNTLYGASVPLDGSDAQLITIDTVTGSGSLVGTVSGYPLIRGLAFDPTSNSLYGVGAGLLLKIDTTNAAAILVGTLGGADFAGLDYDPVSGMLIGSAPSTSELVLLSPVYPETALPYTVIGVTDGRGMLGLAYDPQSGRLFGVNGAGVARLDRTTGRAHFIGCSGLTHVASSAYDPVTATLYVIDIGTEGVEPVFASIDVASGEGTIIGVGFEYGDIAGLAFDRNTGTLYGVTGGYLGIPADGYGSGYRELITLDVVGGGYTSIGTINSSGPGEISGLAYDSTGNKLYGYDEYFGDLYLIDTTTVVLTLVGNTGYTALGCMTYDHVAKKLYGVDYVFGIIEIDPATASGSSLGVPLEGMAALESIR